MYTRSVTCLVKRSNAGRVGLARGSTPQWRALLVAQSRGSWSSSSVAAHGSVLVVLSTDSPQSVPLAQRRARRHRLGASEAVSPWQRREVCTEDALDQISLGKVFLDHGLSSRAAHPENLSRGRPRRPARSRMSLLLATSDACRDVLLAGPTPAVDVSAAVG